MSETFDVVVIGGGIAGAGVAARLAAECRVLLLERETSLAYHTTGRSAALLLDGYGNAVIRALTAAGRREFETPDPSVWPEAILSPRGALTLAVPADVALGEGSAGGDPVSVHEALELVSILRPERIGAAWYDPLARDIDVDLLFQGYLRILRRAGGEVRTGAEVIALTPGRDGWTVETVGGSVQAGVVVNAAGAWADGIAALAGAARLGLQPLRRSAAVIPAPGGRDVSRWPLFVSVREDWYAKPTGGRLMVSPADEDPVAPQDAWADDLVLAEGLDRYGNMVTEPVTRVERSWAGLRSFLPDRTPVCGFDAGLPGFFWLAGQGGYGIQTAPALSRLAADLILGRAPAMAPEVVEALSATRFAG